MQVKSQTGSINWQAGNATVQTSPGSGSAQEGQTDTISFTLAVGAGTMNDCDKPLQITMPISWSGDNKGTKGSGSLGVTITYMKPCPKPM
ncbi:hypothetical protein AB0B89_30155 [Sphaerisporangium sp. NPDC049002]|uniref:hypothetical protein n=1 Tax=Sphaerisporangium sp. NPDC049002 TaxID=3155392 RepID=UPI0033CCB7AB